MVEYSVLKQKRRTWREPGFGSGGRKIPGNAGIAIGKIVQDVKGNRKVGQQKNCSEV